MPVSPSAIMSRVAEFRAETSWVSRLVLVTLLTLAAAEYTRRVVKPLSLALDDDDDDDSSATKSSSSSTSTSNQRRRRQKRRRRVFTAVASVAPLLAFFALAPLAFDPHSEVMSCAISVFVHVWLGSFKVVGLLLGRGPLAAKEYPPSQFAFVFAAPVNPVIGKGSGSSSSSSSGKATARRSPTLRRVPSRSRIAEPLEGGALRRLAVAAAKVALLAPVLSLLKASRQSPGSVPEWIVPYLYIAGLYSVLGMMMDGGGAAAGCLVGLELSPHFDMPQFSSSYADLWGRRWNLVAGHSLRFLVYDPLAERELVKKREKNNGGKTHSKRVGLGRRLMAMSASFVVSGIIHEVVLLYVLPGVSRWTGWWFLFFSGWGLVLAAEKGVKIAAEKALLSSSSRPSPLKKFLLSPPRLLVTPLVVVSSMAYAKLLFLPPPVEQGIAERVMESAAWAVKGILHVDI